MDQEVNAAFTGAHEWPAGARVARVDERQPGKVDAVADGAAQRMDDGKRRDLDAVCFVDHLDVHKVEFGHLDLHAGRVDGTGSGSGVPGQRLLNGFDKVPRAQARFGAAGAPHLDRPVRTPHLCVAAGERNQVGRMVGVQMGKEHLVQQVDWQLQARVVGKGAAPGVEKQEVALRVADFDEDAARGLPASPTDCRCPAPSRAVPRPRAPLRLE